MTKSTARRRRVLVVAPELPHAPLTGAHTRPLSVISALAQRYDVVVVGAASSGADLSALRETGARVLSRERAPYYRSTAGALLSRARQLLTPVPLLERGRFEETARAVREATDAVHPDVLHLVSMYSCWYRDPGLPAIIDLLDVVSGLCAAAAAARPARYALAQLQQRTAERVESRELPMMARVMVINEEDAQRVRRLGVEPVVVPLAVAAPTHAALATAEADATAPGGRSRLRLLFVGNFLHHPNRASAAFLRDELAPALRGLGVVFDLTIAGRAASRVRNGATAPGVEYLEDVPDLSPLYRAADIVVVPVAFGGGTKNKTLEAMAWGKPVVGTPQAFSGVEARDGGAFVSAPLDAAVMAAVIARLAANASLCARLGAASREYVLGNHTQKIVDERVAALYQRVLDAQR